MNQLGSFRRLIRNLRKGAEMKITAIKLVRRGDDAVVEIEINGGAWVEVIREECASNFSHIVEDAGIRKAMMRTDTPVYQEQKMFPGSPPAFFKQGSER